MEIKNDIDYKNSFYGEKRILLDAALSDITTKIELMRKALKIEGKRDPVSYVTARIKSEDSMKEKLQRKGFEVTQKNALTKVYDAVGVRIICSYVNDVYDIIKMLKSESNINVIKEKDYIANPKPNGYRSYHLIVEDTLDIMGKKHKVFVEIQVRTIAMDCWASLEHEIKYKHEIKNQELMVQELRRCADELATADLNMQTIKNMIDE